MTPEPIWHPDPLPNQPRIYLRRRFRLGTEPAAAHWRCACGGPYEVHVNGALVARSPGSTLTGCPVWEEHSLGDLLHAGSNVLLVVAGDGPRPGESDWFVAEGELSGAGGERVGLGTGDGWTTQPAQVWQTFALGVLDGAYVASREPASWQTGEFREDAWVPAVGVPGAEPRPWSPRAASTAEVWAERLVAFGEVECGGEIRFAAEAAPMAHGKCVRGEAVLTPGRRHALVQTRAAERGVCLVLDFGRLVTGYPRLRLRAGEGSVVDLGFARRFGQLDVGLRYVAAAGRREWTGHRLVVCRYLVVRLSHWDQEGEVDCISMVQRAAQVPTRGALDGSEALRQTWQVGLQSVDACRQEAYQLATPTAPFRWLTAWATAQNEFYLTGDLQTAGATLQGLPPPGAEEATEGTAGYALLAATYVHHGGDRDLVRPLLPLILERLGDAGEVGADGPYRAREGGTADLALRAGALEAGAHLCRWLGERRGRVSCGQQHRCCVGALQQAFDPEAGLFAEALGGASAGFSQYTNGLVLLWGAPDPEQRARVVQQFLSEAAVPTRDLTQAFVVAGGLWRAGAGREALAWVEHHWGRLLGHEGGTWGEKLPGVPPDPVPGPEFYLASQVLGVRPAVPGFRVMDVAPQPSGVEQMHGHLLTAAGPVSVEWRAGDGHTLQLRAETPADCQVRLGLPRLDLRFPTLVLNRQIVWRNEKVYPNDFVREVISERERIVLVLPRGGVYEARVE
ncbi:MAG: alpha-L-rhamnosidase C-terminal domain-containing protein [Candidatus Latescibacterota bacterium]